MKQTFLFVLACALVSSCSGVMKVAYGIRNPKVENAESIQHAISKLELQESDNYAYDFDAFRRNQAILKNGIPDVMVFSKTGRFIPYGDEYACNADAFSFIEKLNRKTAYDVNPEITLAGVTAGLTDLHGKPVKVREHGDKDFTVILFWTVYLGRLNKDHVKVWEEQALNNKQADIRVMKINMDFQEHWGEENLEKITTK